MAKKAHRIRKQSEEGSREGWSLQRLIVKSNDDVRQEVFIMQVRSLATPTVAAQHAYCIIHNRVLVHVRTCRHMYPNRAVCLY